MSTHGDGFTAYGDEDDFLSEFYDDPADIERIKAGADRLVRQSRAARLRALRSHARTTLQEVADRMGLQVEDIMALEDGKSFSGAALGGYIDALGGTVDFILVDDQGVRHVVEARCAPVPAAKFSHNRSRFVIIGEGENDQSDLPVPTRSGMATSVASPSFELWVLLHPSLSSPGSYPEAGLFRYSKRQVLLDLVRKRDLQVVPVDLKVVAEVYGLRVEVA